MDHSEVKHLPKVDHTPAKMDEPCRLMLSAASIIERDGWCQNSMTSPSGQVCLEGALLRAYGVKFDHHTGASQMPPNAVFDVLMTIKNRLGGTRPFDWNDTPGRTKEEVVTKLRAVALGL